MKTVHDEQSYPITFRAEEAEQLGNALSRRHSVELVGMKRIGISNFLRFFLYHKDIVKTYIHPEPETKHIFITVDLNDLIELEIVPFWRLTFKRIVDIVNQLPELESYRTRINDQFLKSIQIQDPFFTVDTLRQVLVELTEAGFMPTIFFLRFDRIKDAVTTEFFLNLQGIVEATGQKLSYVFTSYRELHNLAPEVFKKASLSTFSQKIYLKPGNEEDMKAILKTLMKKYSLSFDKAVQEEIITQCGGHVQYMQLALIILSEMMHKHGNIPADYMTQIAEDERVTLQSEELFAELTDNEQNILMKIYSDSKVSSEEHGTAPYLWNSGYVEENHTEHVFSPLFASYLTFKDKYQNKAKITLGLTKKEQLLYNVLKAHENEICEREDIIEAVWPECNEIGVSDWALDRLVSRLRSKLKLQDSSEEIQTVKTRGFKMIIK